jgi:hypothetical protein
MVVRATSATTDRDLTAEARALASRVADDEFGWVSASVYETARLVSGAASLDGHRDRVRFLVSSQADSGGWGGVNGYELVPTLSATEALLAGLRRGDRHGALESGHALAAAHRGLRRIHGLMTDAGISLPDTIAVEVIAPYLIERLDRELDRVESDRLPGLDAWRTRRFTPLANPGLARDAARLDDLRSRLRAGQPPPKKLWHSLEAFDTAARDATGVRAHGGAVGCSPAATAAWIGPDGAPPREGDRNADSMRYLRAVQARGRGAVASISPMTVFERAWVVAALAEAGLAACVPWRLITWLRETLGPDGAPAAVGLPPDADDTAAVLHALFEAGCPGDPARLRHFDNGQYFVCFIGERTPSTSTNAHVLTALRDYLGRCAAHEGEPWRVVHRRVADWLLEQQSDEGSWIDKWHASPFYATNCCVAALEGVPRAREAVARAVDWVMETQRPDGSWGRWCGTAEETAYALRVLLRAPLSRSADGRVRAGLVRGRAYLNSLPIGAGHPALWHDKDLYAPLAVIAAEIIAALELTSRVVEGG